MKQIDFNEDLLTMEEIDKITNKVRGIVLNTNTNQILLVNYAELFMLPGGKVDAGETDYEALKREIVEESGIDFDEEINPFLQINSYDKNYYDRKCGVINRLTRTLFYVIETTKDIEESKKVLTESEKAKKHMISYVDIDTIEDLVESNQTSNSKRKQFDREILTVLDEFKKLDQFNKVKLKSKFN